MLLYVCKCMGLLYSGCLSGLAIMERAIVAGFDAAKHGEFSYQGHFDRGSHPTASAECDLSLIVFLVCFKTVRSTVYYFLSFTHLPCVQQSGGNLSEISLFLQGFVPFYPRRYQLLRPQRGVLNVVWLCGEDPEG